MAFYNLFFFIFFNTKSVGGKALGAIPNSAMLQTRFWGGGRVCLFSTDIPTPDRSKKGEENLDFPQKFRGCVEEDENKTEKGRWIVLKNPPSWGGCGGEVALSPHSWDG